MWIIVCANRCVQMSRCACAFRCRSLWFWSSSFVQRVSSLLWSRTLFTLNRNPRSARERGVGRGCELGSGECPIERTGWCGASSNRSGRMNPIFTDTLHFIVHTQILLLQRTPKHIQNASPTHTPTRARIHMLASCVTFSCELGY
jgi:hypothetical protein